MRVYAAFVHETDPLPISLYSDAGEVGQLSIQQAEELMEQIKSAMDTFARRVEDPYEGDQNAWQEGEKHDV